MICIKCDKCRKALDEEPSYRIEVRDMQYSIFNDAAKSRYDLCEDCHEELLDWFHKRKAQDD